MDEDMDTAAEEVAAGEVAAEEVVVEEVAVGEADVEEEDHSPQAVLLQTHWLVPPRTHLAEGLLDCPESLAVQRRKVSLLRNWHETRRHRRKTEIKITSNQYSRKWRISL